MKTVRIASGAGYGGDRIEAALDIISHDAADYIIFECLAERTIALAQKEKRKNPQRGYNALLEYRMEQILPLLKEHPVKIITNMGAANPEAAARKIREMADFHGLTGLKIAVITGDDILSVLPSYYDREVMETGFPLIKLKDKIISANAYIGAQGITNALAAGADLVITGRVADPALTTGPLMYEFSGSYENYDFLGKTVVAGHLLECGAQVTGGYYADPGKKEVERLWEIGFPIIEFSEDGSMVVTKLPGSGGLLNTETVKEQLLYEIQDPAAYFTPDVVADFSHLCVKELAQERIRISDATGNPRTGTLKVSVGYEEGYIGTGEISYGGQNCISRAQLAAEIIDHRLEHYPEKPLEKRVDLLGVNSLYRDRSPIPEDLLEVRMRYAIRTETKALAQTLTEEVEALYTNGPAGGGGVRGSVTEVVSIASILVDEKEVAQKIQFL